MSTACAHQICGQRCFHIDTGGHAEFLAAWGWGRGDDCGLSPFLQLLRYEGLDVEEDLKGAASVKTELQEYRFRDPKHSEQD